MTLSGKTRASIMGAPMKRFGLILFLASAGLTQDRPNGSVVTDPAQEKHYFQFFVRAETYLGMPRSEKVAYVTGLLDGRLNAGRFGDRKTITAMRACMNDKTGSQIAAIADKYIQSHPEDWDKPASVEIDDALDESICHIPY